MRAYFHNALMKPVSVLCVLFLAIFSASAQNTGSVKDVLTKVEKASGFTFFYNAEDLKGLDVSSVDTSAPIQQILESLFGNTSISYRIQGKEIILQSKNVKNTASASYVLSGTVVDAADGQPAIGAAVMISGTTKGVVTDYNGEFSLEVTPDAVLSVENLGYKSAQVAVEGRRTLTIELEADALMLDAVVMMGYSSLKKTELSSSVVTVEGESLRDVSTPDVGNMLQGKVAGVLVYNASGMPGEAAQIRVRGTGSISASADPLYVVDGIPGGSFNPNDVETITVLKDAGATALYGSSAAGGVIVVTTKKAKAGQNTSVEFKAQGGLKQALSGRFHPMNSQELYDITKKLYSKAVFNILYPKTVLDTDFDWMNESFKLGNTQDYYASVSGSADKITYFVSLDHYREKGTLINTGYKATNGRINLGIKVSDNLDLNVRMNFTDSANQGTSSYVTLESAYRMSPWDTPYDKNTGEPMYVNSGTRSDDGGTWWSHDKYNIFHNELYNSAKSNGINLSNDIQLNWRISEHVSFSSTNRYATSSSTWKLVVDPRTASASYPDGFIQKDITTGRSFSTSNLLKYANSIDGIHNINALAGYEWGQWKNDFTSAKGVSMKNGLTVLNAAAADGVGGRIVEGKGWSVFGQAQYSYMEKYIVSASLRADANSVFAPKQRVGLFPSVSGAWLASKEDFLASQDLISFLKFRASYGETGNSGIEPYSYLSVYTFTDATQYQGSVGSFPASQENPYLHWEKAKMTNLGADLNIKDFLEFNVDIYHILNTDLLLDVPTAPSTGFYSIKQNTGTIRNMGIEFQINSTNIHTKKFNWTTSFNIGFNKNTVIDIPGSKDIIQTVGSNSARQIIREGEALYSWYMPKWIGVDPETGDPLWEHLVRDDNGDVIGTEPTNIFNPDADSQIVGHAAPLFSGGLVNNFSFGPFSLAINMNYVVGNKIFNFTRTSMDSDGVYTDYNQMSIDNGLGWTRWEKKGDIATHPKPMAGGNHNSNGISSRYLEDGSFLRVKNITFSYTLPSALTRKINVSEAKVFVTGDNLLTLTRFSGMDPEVRLESTMYELAGMYSMNYPVGRVFALGVNLKF